LPFYGTSLGGKKTAGVIVLFLKLKRGRFQTEGMEIDKVLKIIITVFANTADVFTIRAGHTGSLLDKDADFFDAGFDL